MSEMKLQDRFFIDVSGDDESLKMIHSLLKDVNDKKYGRKIILKDLLLVGLSKLKVKDLERIKETSLSATDLVKRKADEYNKAHGTTFGLYDYIEVMLKSGRSIL